MTTVHDPRSSARSSAGSSVGSAVPRADSSRAEPGGPGTGKPRMVRTRYGPVAGSAVRASVAAASEEHGHAPHPRSRSAAQRTRPSSRVTARTPLTRESLPERAEVQHSPRLSAALQRLWDDAARESREAAARHRALAALWTEPVEDSDAEDPADLVELQVACALRTTRGRARGLVEDAHRAVEMMPRTFALLEAGAMPAEWFARLLRTSQGLGPEASGRLDERVASWDMGITAERFRRELSRAVSWFRAEQEEPSLTPEEQRRVETFARPDGTASLIVTGPVPEILSLSRRLDDAARALRTAQRTALAEGLPVPFDDGSVAESGRAMLPKDLRYAILTRSVLETGGVEVPAERYRLNVIVPVLTLLGHSDAPGTIEGIAPIPAVMARGLAAGIDGWERVLTDPTTGAFLPLPTQRYRPTPAMREHLRLRGAQCTVPGCVRAVTWASETDHIEEFDHRFPAEGGRTEIENLHHLCPAHHAMKTAGRIDPVRRPGGIEVVESEASGQAACETDSGNEPPPGPPRQDAPCRADAPPRWDTSAGSGPPDRSAFQDRSEVRQRMEPQQGVERPRGSEAPLCAERPESAEPAHSSSSPVPAPHTIVHPGSTTWRLGPDATVTVPDDTDLTTPEMVERFHRLWAVYRQAEQERQTATERQSELRRQAGRAREAGDGAPPWWAGDPTF